MRYRTEARDRDTFSSFMDASNRRIASIQTVVEANSARVAAFLNGPRNVVQLRLLKQAAIDVICACIVTLAVEAQKWLISYGDSP